MNLVHLKYAVEVAETGSINKASEKLYVSQPNLSRAIKELEASLGVTIFDRSAKGMVLTPDGEVFVRYARSILRQVDAIEEVFSKGTTEKKKFSISVPRASYVTDAFAEFSKLLDLGFVDTFRKLHPEEKKYSYWSYFRNARKTNAGWRLDYMLVTEDIFQLVKRSEILNDVFGSDHCPVLLEIDFSQNN